MQPSRSSSGIEGRHSLGNQPESQSGQNVARPCCRKPWRGVAINGGMAIRPGDGGIGPLQQNDSTGVRGCGASL